MRMQAISMRRLRVDILALAVIAVTGCASLSPATLPAAGIWYGSAWANCTEAVQGYEGLEFTFDADGRWTANIGARRATGTARLERGRIVLEGTVVGQPLVPVYYSLAPSPDGTLYSLTMLSAPPGKGAFPAQVQLRRGRY